MLFDLWKLIVNGFVLELVFRLVKGLGGVFVMGFGLVLRLGVEDFCFVDFDVKFFKIDIVMFV